MQEEICLIFTILVTNFYRVEKSTYHFNEEITCLFLLPSILNIYQLAINDIIIDILHLICNDHIIIL